MAPQAQDERYPPGAVPEKARAAATSDSGSDASRPLENREEKPADLLAEILAGVYRAEGMTAQGFAALRERLATIEEKLSVGIDTDSSAGDGPETPDDVASVAPDEQSADSPLEDVAVSHESSEIETFPELTPVVQSAEIPAAAESQLPPMAQPVTPSQGMPRPTQPVRDVRPVASPQSLAPTTGELEATVFGQDFSNHQSLLPHRQQLLTSARQGQEDAVGLLGQLLILRSAAMDRLPTLLKDVGEAWYRWQGEDHSAEPLRDALIAWLHTKLEAVGLGNRIDLVRVGDRYDSKRHNARNRGIEVTGVQGWVVLRDNGNVYTKANVTVA